METFPSSPNAQVIAQEHVADIVAAFLYYYDGLKMLPEDCTILTDSASLSEDNRCELLLMHKNYGFFGITFAYDSASGKLSDFRIGPANTSIETY